MTFSDLLRSRSFRTPLVLGSVCPMLLLLFCSMFGQAQQVSTNTNVVVPPLVKFSGVLTDVDGKPLTDVVGVTFSLYKDEQGGAALWMETQNVHPNQAGHYTVMLGASSSDGLPAEIFTSGEAHWLGVQAQGQAEQARILLVSVPYAMKAGDAATLNGLPPSAFVLAAPPTASGTASSASDSLTAATVGAATVGGGGTTNFIPIWTGAATQGNSALFQTSGNVGLGNTRRPRSWTSAAAEFSVALCKCRRPARPRPH